MIQLLSSKHMTRNVLCNVVMSKQIRKFYHVLYEKMNQEGCRGQWSWSILWITIQEWVTTSRRSQYNSGLTASASSVFHKYHFKYCDAWPYSRIYFEGLRISVRPDNFQMHAFGTSFTEFVMRIIRYKYTL